MHSPKTYVRIPEKMWRVHKEPTSDYVYMCHYEDNAKFKSRQKTGHRFALTEKVSYISNPKTGNSERIVTPISTKEEIFDNELTEGFKVEANYSGYYKTDALWKVTDPRGFTHDVFMGNVNDILKSATIVNGVIQGKCCWGRNYRDNILLHEDSQLYKDARYETDVDKAVGSIPRIHMSKVKPGMEVSLRDGTKGIYIGKFYVREFTHRGPISYRSYATKQHFLKKADGTFHRTGASIDIVKKSGYPSYEDSTFWMKQMCDHVVATSKKEGLGYWSCFVPSETPLKSGDDVVEHMKSLGYEVKKITEERGSMSVHSYTNEFYRISKKED